MSLNVVVIGGRLGKDPELRDTKNGKKVCEISVAVDTGYGENKNTAWIKVTCWGKTAEFVEKYFGKGKPIVVTGRLDEEKWKDKESGKDRSRVFIVADKVDFAMGGKDGQGAPRADSDEPAKVQSTLSATLNGDDDSEIPF